jgi:hypothetical protein
MDVQRKYAEKAMAEFTKKPVESSVVSFLLMQGATFADFVTNLTNYYRKTIEDLTAFLEKVKADDSPAMGKKNTPSSPSQWRASDGNWITSTFTPAHEHRPAL